MAGGVIVYHMIGTGITELKTSLRAASIVGLHHSVIHGRAARVYVVAGYHVRTRYIMHQVPGRAVVSCIFTQG